jgi:hypothetical protein
MYTKQQMREKFSATPNLVALLASSLGLGVSVLSA